MSYIDTYCQSLIDTVLLTMQCTCPDIDWQSTEISKFGEERKKGHVNNMRVTWGNGTLRVTGSLPKLHNGGNFLNLNTQEIKQAISVLELKLNVNLQNADVKRVDLATNIRLSQKIDNFFPCLGAYKSAHRSNIEAATLYYKRKDFFTLIFYDKIKEMKHKQYNNQLLHTENNIMRFEVRFFRKNLRSLFKEHLKVKDLTKEDTNCYFAKLWYDEYLAIDKQAPIRFDLKEKDGWKHIVGKLTKMGIDKLGGLNETIECLRRESNFNEQRPENKSRVLKRLRLIDKKWNCNKDNTLLIELNNAFAIAYAQLVKSNKTSLLK